MIMLLASAVLDSSRRSVGVRKMNPQPSSSSPVLATVAGAARTGRSSSRPIARMPRADSRKLTALAATVVTGPKMPISAPPSGGPSRVAVQVVDSKRVLARSRCSRGTSDFRHEPLAAVNVMSAAATRTATRTSCPNRSQPSAYASGTLSTAAKRTRSMAIITGRLRRNSTHGPSGTATSAPTASPAAASIDTSRALAWSTSTASSGKASKASQVPRVLMANAAHSQPNCRPSRPRPTTALPCDVVRPGPGRTRPPPACQPPKLLKSILSRSTVPAPSTAITCPEMKRAASVHRKRTR